MKYLVLLLLFASCRNEPEYHPIIYTSEWACEQERLVGMDSIAKLSKAIDTLIARRNRIDTGSPKWNLYNIAILKLSQKVTDSTLSKYVLDYNARRIGFDPKKVQKDAHYGR